MRLQLVFFLKLPVAKPASELEVILRVNLPVRHHGVHAVKHPSAIGTNSFLVVPQVQPQRFPMFVRDSADLTRVRPFRRVDLTDVLLHDRRSGKQRITLGALGALLCVAEHVAVQGGLAAEPLRTVRTLIGQFAGMKPHVDFERSFVHEAPMALFTLEFFYSVMDLFVLLQSGSKFEPFTAYFAKNNRFG